MKTFMWLIMTVIGTFMFVGGLVGFINFVFVIIGIVMASTGSVMFNLSMDDDCYEDLEAE